jgi:hypothetical protein
LRVFVLGVQDLAPSLFDHGFAPPFADVSDAHRAMNDTANRLANMGFFSGMVLRSEANAQHMPPGSTDNAATTYANAIFDTIGGPGVPQPGPSITGLAERSRQAELLQQEVLDSLEHLQTDSQAVADLWGGGYNDRVSDLWIATSQVLADRSVTPNVDEQMQALEADWDALASELPQGAPSLDLYELQLRNTADIISEDPGEESSPLQLLRELIESVLVQLEYLRREPHPGVLQAAARGRVGQVRDNAVTGRQNSVHHQSTGGSPWRTPINMGSSRVSRLLLDFENRGTPDSMWQRTVNKLHKDTRVGSNRAREDDNLRESPAELFDNHIVPLLDSHLSRFHELLPHAEELLQQADMQPLLQSHALSGGWEWSSRILASSLLLAELQEKGCTEHAQLFVRALYYDRRRTSEWGFTEGFGGKNHSLVDLLCFTPPLTRQQRCCIRSRWLLWLHPAGF